MKGGWREAKRFIIYFKVQHRAVSTGLYDWKYRAAGWKVEGNGADKYWANTVEILGNGADKYWAINHRAHNSPPPAPPSDELFC